MKITFVLGLLALSLAAPVFVQADEEATSETMAMGTTVDSQPQVPVEVGNKICPIEGGKIGSMGEPYKVTHNGKVYNLCCQGCEEDFHKDADKYSKMADDEVRITQEAIGTPQEPATMN